MRVRWAAVVATVLLLSGCADAVAGHGRSSAPTGSPTSSTSSSSPAGVTYPSGLLRPMVSTALGDPVTADVCALVDDNTFSRFGEVLEPKGVQYAGFCSRDIDDSGNRIATIGVFLNSTADVSTAGSTRTTVSGVDVYQFPASDVCARLVISGGLAARVSANADAPSPVLCQMADLLVTAVAARIAARQVLPRRAIAPAGSLTELDLCKLAVSAGLPAGVPTFRGASAQPNSFGADCQFVVGHRTLFLDVAFQYLNVFDGTPQVTVAGHTFYRMDSGRDCLTASLQQGAGNGEQEVLVTEALTDQPTADTSLCGDASNALARMLDAAGLS